VIDTLAPGEPDNYRGGQQTAEIDTSVVDMMMVVWNHAMYNYEAPYNVHARTICQYDALPTNVQFTAPNTCRRLDVRLLRARTICARRRPSAWWLVTPST